MGGLQSNRMTVQSGRGTRSSRRGFFIVLVLIVVIVATLSVYSFTGMMIAYDDAAYLSNDIVRARVAAESGGEAIRLILSQPPLSRDEIGGVYNNPDLFQAIPVSTLDPTNPCNFSVVAPDLNENGMLSGLRFGLQDESARLNLNTLVILDENSEGLMAALKIVCFEWVLRYSITSLEPAINPPVLAIDLERLPQMTSTLWVRSRYPTVPCPRSPRTPNPWASSTTTKQLCPRQTSRISCSLEIWPSME